MTGRLQVTISTLTLFLILPSCTLLHPSKNEIGIELTRTIGEQQLSGFIVIGDDIPADTLPANKRQEIEGQLRWHWMRNGNIPNTCFYLNEGQGTSEPTFGVTHLSKAGSRYAGNLLVWPDASYSITLDINGEYVTGNTSFSGGPVITIRNEDGTESEEAGADEPFPIVGRLVKSFSMSDCLERLAKIP